MNVKKLIFDRIERNSIQINVEGEDIYLKKSGDWHVIYPPIDIRSVEDATDDDGNIDWSKVKWNKINLIFGSKSNAIISSIVAIITLLFAFGAWQLVQSYNLIATNQIVKECLKSAGLVLTSS